MNIRFINTTTRLPVDGEIESEFLETIHPAFRDAIEYRPPRFEENADIFFVDENDLDLERERLEGETDVLGVYFPLHPEFHRRIIKVSPEKVWDACKSFGGSLPQVRRYPTLLLAVVIHELAHWIMDDSEVFDYNVVSWKRWAENRPDDNIPTSSCICADFSLHLKWQQLCHFIEESLANAFTLKQKLTQRERDFLKACMATEPEGYKQGGLWSGNLQSTLKTARSWARFKRRYGDRDRWNFVFDSLEPETPVEEVVGRLDKGQSIRSVDFVHEFHIHLASRVDAWQSAYQGSAPGTQQQKDWNKRLNEAFGVFRELTTWADLTPARRLKLLKQWAANGSAEAVDKLHETLAENAKAKGKYAPALQHLRNRLQHLPKLKQNACRHQRYTDEINASIGELQALMGQLSVSTPSANASP